MRYPDFKLVVLLLFLLNTSMVFSLENLMPEEGSNKDTVNIYSSPFIFKSLKSTGSPIFSETITSPDEKIELSIEISQNEIVYSISKNGDLVIDKSILDLQLSTGNVALGLSVEDSNIDEINEDLEIPYGEKSIVKNHCEEFVVSLVNSENIRFQLIFRVYNQGVGFRYFFPEENSISTIHIQNEFSQFTLADSYTAYNETYNERGYHTSSLDNVRSLIPLTLSGTDYSLCINEAGNDDFARIALQGSGNTLQSYFIGSRLSHSLPYSLPWRYVVIGGNDNELIANKDILYALNDHEFNMNQWDWVRPGKVFRCLDLTTEGAKDAIDFCQGLNIEYMMFDAGWYGLGYGQSKEKDPDSDPMDVIDGLDMIEVTNYARQKGVGVILYINKVAWYNYDNQAMFDLYESWGISGLKLGFMDGYSSYGINRVYEIIREAGNREMVVNVHDNFRPTGMIRKYPNLLTSEGVRGNEYVTNTGEHTTLLPYTRMLTGATDYTICYKGNDPDYPSKLMNNVTTKGHQLAMSVVNYSPLQHVMWYGRPYIYQKPVETELFSFLPTVWDESKVQSGMMGEVFSIARKTGDNWFLATINDVYAKEVSIPLDFLEGVREFNLVIYEDSGSESIKKTEGDFEFWESEGKIIGNNLLMNLQGNGGQVAVFKELNSSTLHEPLEEKREISIYPNPASDYFFVELNDSSISNIRVSVISVDGRKICSKSLSSSNQKFRVDIAPVPSGAYLITVQAAGKEFSEIIYLK